MSPYLWIFVVGSLGAFGFGWGTGANDVGNAFGTSVGAKTLTMKQAVILATIFEFTGALVLGRVSTDTIAGGIADIARFKNNPMVYAYGMMCNLWIGTLWLAFTSYKGWNVSSTHSIIGGILGFSLVYAGKDGVMWAIPDPKAFPPYKGVVPIILSWFVSPILTGAASALIYTTTRSLVLRRPNAYQLSYYVLPPMVLLTTWINVYFVLTKGAKKSLQGSDEWSDEKSLWVTSIIAFGCSLLSGVIGIPLLKRRIERLPEVCIESNVSSIASPDSEPKNLLLKGIQTDIHQIIDEDPVVAAIHENAELFDPKTESVFQYLQVFSAICVIFAHGAGEVGYMAGPLAAIWDIVNTGKIQKSVTAPIWIIVIGASGLVVGLATYGYKITQAMGVKMSKITATRGFAAELATAFVIMIASQYGLPTSSSQCITGGILGVGLAEGVKGVNWRFLGLTVFSWVNTMFVIGMGVAAVFAQGIYAPHRG
jgi:sodium-dependent phosphate transporter